jgi:hypothetical protein
MRQRRYSLPPFLRFRSELFPECGVIPFSWKTQAVATTIETVADLPRYFHVPIPLVKPVSPFLGPLRVWLLVYLSELALTRDAVTLRIGTCVRFDPALVAKWLWAQ